MKTTMKMLTQRFRIQSALKVVSCVLPLALVACSGEGQLLQEAVEVNELDLSTIQIKQPPSRLEEIFLNPGEEVGFSIEARNSDNELVDLSSANRRWSIIGSTAVASIDENGVLTARADGSVTVRVQVGRFDITYPQPVTVQLDTLVSITEFEGPTALERCIPQDYSAIGTFNMGSTRRLTSVDWSVEDVAFGSVTNEDNGVVSLNATNSPSVVLVARVGDRVRRETITVLDTLLSIEITPETLSLTEDNTLSLGATGTYLRDGVERRVSLTNNIIWGVPQSNGIVTISNESPTVGVVTSEAVGNTEVTAVCGNTREQKAIVVID